MTLNKIARTVTFLVTLTVIATLGVPMNENISVGAKEALNTITKASALHSGDLDELRHYFKDDVTVLSTTKMIAVNSQDTLSFRSKDHQIQSSNQDAGFFKKNGVDLTSDYIGNTPSNSSPLKNCDCEMIPFTNDLARFSGPDLTFKPMEVGDLPQALAISKISAISNACGLSDWSAFCGALKFMFTISATNQQITEFPYKGLIWENRTLKLTLNPTSNADLGDHSVKMAIMLYLHPEINQVFLISYNIAPSSIYQRNLQTSSCTLPATNVNMLNTDVLTEQSAYGVGHSTAANQACDGVTRKNTPDTWDKLVDVQSLAGVYFWVAKFSTSVRIQTVLYVAQGYIVSTNQFRVGDDPTNSFLNNPQCTSSQPSISGWFTCAATGKYFAITSTTSASIYFMEVMLYTQEAIHFLAKSATMSSTSTIITNYLCGTGTNCQAVNVLKSSVETQASCIDCCVISNSQTDPELTVTFNADVLIDVVILIPSDQGNGNTVMTTWQTNVEIYIVNLAGIQQFCGTLADYNEYKEMPCNKIGNKAIIKKTGPSMTLAMCGIGILSSCDCSQSSFEPALISFPAVMFASTTTLNSTWTDPPKSITFNTQMPDTVSAVCGLADGFTKCGGSSGRVIVFKDKTTGLLITFPYNGFQWNAVTSVLTLNPAQASQICVLTAILLLKNYPTVTYSQDITSTAVVQLSTPDQKLVALIGQEALVLLPKIIGALYFVTSKPTFKATVEGQTLKVISQNNKDIGTQSLQMSALYAQQTSNFTVKVIFEAQLAIVTGNNSTTTSTKTTATTNSTSSKSQTVNQTYDSASPENLTATESTVLSESETNSLLDTVICSEDDAGHISCRIAGGPQYFIDLLTGNFMSREQTKISENKTSAPPPQPNLVISKVNNRGAFSMKFSDPMNLEALISPTSQLRRLNASKAKAKKVRNLKAKGGGQSSAKGTSGAQTVKNKTNQGDDNESNPNNLLSAKHLRLSIQSENTTTPVFSWHATNITSSEIVIQLVFRDPLYISNQPGLLDKLIITILPPALKYMKTLATGALAEKPLRTVFKELPPQVILGKAIESVETASETLKNVGKSSTIGNVAVQILLSGSMAQMWSMVNAQQIIMTYQLLNLQMPGNVIMVMTNLADICDFNVFPTDAIMSFLFKFTPTDPPGVGFETMGTDNKSLTLYLGSSFLIMILIGLHYLLYSLVFGLRHTSKLLKWVEYKLRPGLFFGTIYLFLVETYLDWAIGSALRLEQPKFVTSSDNFDFGLALCGILITFVLPCYSFFLLRKNINLLQDKDFRAKHGSLYEGFMTENAEKRQASINMAGWFLLRRFFTAVNLVLLRNQTIWIQLTLNMWLSLIDVSVKFHWSPYESSVLSIMEKFNDVLVLTCSYFTYLFTDRIQSQEDKYYIGWYYMGIIGMLIAANLFVMAMTAYQMLKEKIIRMIKSCKHKNATEMQNIKRKAQEAAMLKVKLNKKDGQVVAIERPGSAFSFSSVESMDEREMFEQFKAYKRLVRKKAREAALEHKITEELKEIPEVQEFSSMESELVNMEARIIVRNQNQVVPFTQREDQQFVEMSFGKGQKSSSQETSEYIQSLKSTEFVQPSAEKHAGESQLIADLLVDVKVKRSSYFEQQMSKYNQMLDDRHKFLVQEIEERKIKRKRNGWNN